MFSKSRTNEPAPKTGETPAAKPAAAPASKPRAEATQAAASKPKAPASIMSSDLTISGNLKTPGDLQIEGTVEGDVRAHMLTVGESAVVRGEIMADDVIVNGRIVGRVRGLKVRLTSTARVEGDIIHKTIAIESGAHFEGSVQRQDDPLNASASGASKAAPASSGSSSS